MGEGTVSLSELQMELYRRNGFVNGGPVLDDETVEVLRAETLRVIDDRNNPQVQQPLGVYGPRALVAWGPGDVGPGYHDRPAPSW